MEAVVTLKAAPADFDLLRESLIKHKQVLTEDIENRNYDHKEAREARVTVIRLDDLIKKLGG